MDRMNSNNAGSNSSLNVSTASFHGPEMVHGLSANCIVDASNTTRCPTILPSPVHLGATFNKSLYRAVAAMASDEQRAYANHAGSTNNGPVGYSARGPVLNMQAHVLWGRNHNSPTEDPVHMGDYGTKFARGLQEGTAEEQRALLASGRTPYIKVASELKHFAAY